MFGSLNPLGQQQPSLHFSAWVVSGMSLTHRILKGRPGRLRQFLTVSVVLLAWSVFAYAQTVELSGQASGWATTKNDETIAGLRYIPDLTLMKHLSSDYEISAEAALNAQWFSRFDGWDSGEGASAVDTYRLWVRLATSQCEVRAGLQKISFGTATLLRPLMWFDSIDPRDPLQLTNGVYGLLGRYYFLNNANIWAWALYGNEDLKGWETLPSDGREIEFGGRLQMPVPAGEMGLSYHHRRINPNGSTLSVQYPAQGKFPEQRIGLDGKWDVGVGLWFEGTVTRQDFDVPEPRYQQLLTLGIDYTFAVGNGLHLMGEHLERVKSNHALSSGDGQSISALSGDYPVSLLDTVSAIVYHDWGSNDWSRFLSWRRTYDKWQVYVSAFWNPDQSLIAQEDTAGINSYAGKGIQLMLVFNH
jgi:hypothetical protein